MKILIIEKGNIIAINPVDDNFDPDTLHCIEVGGHKCVLVADDYPCALDDSEPMDGDYVASYQSA